jgi:FkbM family methyltransferase
MIYRLKRIVHQRAQRYIASHRRGALMRKIAGYSDLFRTWHRNLDGDPRYNGEEFVLRTLQPFGLETIFDVGANVGDWSRMARSLFPEARIHAFEIAPPTARLVEEAFQGDTRFVLNACGLSNADGEIEIKYYPEDGALSSLIDYPHQRRVEMISARVTTGDGYVSANGIERIDFFKMDVEGAEHLVLEGLRETLRGGKISALQFEYGTVNIVTKFLLRDFYRTFEEAGFRVGKIFPNYVDFREYSFDQEDFLGQNYLAISTRLPEWIRALQA